MNRTTSRAVGMLAAGVLACSATAFTTTGASAALPSRTITESLVQPDPEVPNIYFRGHVSGGYANKTVNIQRKFCKSCDWQFFTTTKTSSTSRYRVLVAVPVRDGKRWYYRAKVWRSGGFATSYSRGLWYTCAEEPC